MEINENKLNVLPVNHTQCNRSVAAAALTSPKPRVFRISNLTGNSILNKTPAETGPRNLETIGSML
jgi:hypothetical protein